MKHDLTPKRRLGLDRPEYGRRDLIGALLLLAAFWAALYWVLR